LWPDYVLMALSFGVSGGTGRPKRFTLFFRQPVRWHRKHFVWWATAVRRFTESDAGASARASRECERRPGVTGRGAKLNENSLRYPAPTALFWAAPACGAPIWLAHISRKPIGETPNLREAQLRDAILDHARADQRCLFRRWHPANLTVRGPPRQRYDLRQFSKCDLYGAKLGGASV